MISKLWGALMLKLSRLIVAIENAFHKKEPSEETTYTTPDDFDTKHADIDIAKRRKKAICDSHDYCEQCVFFHGYCILAYDSDEGIPCYWEVDE